MTAEQQARDLLDKMGCDAGSWSAGELVELSNIIAERDKLKQSHTESNLLHTMYRLVVKERDYERRKAILAENLLRRLEQTARLLEARCPDCQQILRSEYSHAQNCELATFYTY